MHKSLHALVQTSLFLERVGSESLQGARKQREIITLRVKIINFKKLGRDFSGSPVVRTSLSMQEGAGLISGPGVRSQMPPGQNINT